MLQAATLLVLLATSAVGTSCHRGKTAKLASGSSTLFVVNDTDLDAVAYFAFGSNSVVLPASWSFCTSTSNLTCSFKLPAHKTQDLPLSGQYLNVTIAFDAGVGCGSTKAEVNINNPSWYDILDVSLVDGYSNRIAIAVDYIASAPGVPTKTPYTIGPPMGQTGNEKVFGVFPYGCDICVERQSPPCGIPTGKSGCKSGTQYKPDVPCQYQGPTMGGGALIKVSLVK
jgi:hypothetical protein